MDMPSHRSKHLVDQIVLAGPDLVQIGFQELRDARFIIAGFASRMRRDEDVRHRPQRRSSAAVHRRYHPATPFDLSVGVCLDESLFIDASAARRIDQIGAALEPRQRLLVDDIARFIGQRTGEGDKVGARQKLVKLRRGVNFVRMPLLGQIVAAKAMTSMSKAFASFARRPPMRPRPKMTSVFPARSSSRTA